MRPSSNRVYYYSLYSLLAARRFATTRSMALSEASSDRFSLKDHLFNEEKVKLLTKRLQDVHKKFPQDAFEEDVLSAFPQLELKERIAHISSCLHEHIDQDYPATIDILLRSLPPELDPHKSDDDFGDFIWAPYSHYVAAHGCSLEHLELSLDAMYAMTKRFSVEFSIRTFLNHYPEETMAFLEQCASDDNYHVRRLASEGTRPKLPWAEKLTKVDYKDPLPILDQLAADSKRYVTRSVANHLHDISKIDAELAVNTLIRWKAKHASAEMDYICQHSLRTLVKQKDKSALALLGFISPKVVISDFETTTPKVAIGEAFEFTLNLKSLTKQSLVLDYSMEFASGPKSKRTSSKVFKLKKLETKKGQKVLVRKRHPMRIMTTRKLHPGKHKITLQINGEIFGELEFTLTKST